MTQLQELRQELANKKREIEALKQAVRTLQLVVDGFRRDFLNQ